LALRTEKEEMLAGDLYDPADADLQAEIEANHRWLVRYNAGLGTPVSQRRTLLLDRLAAVGEGAVMRPPFHCDYGFNISLGADVFLNFNCVILDVVQVTIGDGTQIEPAVQILATDHPRDVEGRASGLEFGAGSVVTRDIPAGAGAFGNPARVRQ
jgi:maltose O-acetyltransferase